MATKKRTTLSKILAPFSSLVLGAGIALGMGAPNTAAAQQRAQYIPYERALHSGTAHVVERDGTKEYALFCLTKPDAKATACPKGIAGITVPKIPEIPTFVQLPGELRKRGRGLVDKDIKKDALRLTLTDLDPEDKDKTITVAYGQYFHTSFTNGNYTVALNAVKGDETILIYTSNWYKQEQVPEQLQGIVTRRARPLEERVAEAPKPPEPAPSIGPGTPPAEPPKPGTTPPEEPSLAPLDTYNLVLRDAQGTTIPIREVKKGVRGKAETPLNLGERYTVQLDNGDVETIHSPLTIKRLRKSGLEEAASKGDIQTINYGTKKSSFDFDNLDTEGVVSGEPLVLYVPLTDSAGSKQVDELVIHTVEKKAPPVATPKPTFLQFLAEHGGLSATLGTFAMNQDHHYIDTTGLGEQVHQRNRAGIGLELGGRLGPVSFSGNVSYESLGGSLGSRLFDAATGENRGTEDAQKLQAGGALTGHFYDQEERRLGDSTLRARANYFTHTNDVMTIDTIPIKTNVDAWTGGVDLTAPQLIIPGKDRLGLALGGSLENITASQDIEGQKEPLGTGLNWDAYTHVTGTFSDWKGYAGARVRSQANPQYPGQDTTKIADATNGYNLELGGETPAFKLLGYPLRAGVNVSLIPLANDNGRWSGSAYLDSDHARLTVGYTQRDLTNSSLGIANPAAVGTALREIDNRGPFIALDLKLDAGKKAQRTQTSITLPRDATNFEP